MLALLALSQTQSPSKAAELVDLLRRGLPGSRRQFPPVVNRHVSSFCRPLQRTHTASEADVLRFEHGHVFCNDLAGFLLFVCMLYPRNRGGRKMPSS